MGNCCSSTSSAVVVPPVRRSLSASAKESPVRSSETRRYSTGPLTVKDLHLRTTAPPRANVFTSGNYKLSYAFVSQRGYYPDALNKPNQDAFTCLPTFYQDKSFFGVFDGHGTTGEHCAQFARDKVPSLLEEHLKDGKNLTQALTEAHVMANEEIHNAPFDDSMSGTTAISVLFDGNEIHVSNVGDSRAIIAQEVVPEGESIAQLVAKPLSIDQTPFRKDERERVKKTGARIMTVDQLEGYEPLHENWGLTLGDEIDESGDPPRIWHPHGDYPGTAFTRSIGDKVSEELGVFAEPEIITKALGVHDKFLVIASDGVFEFLTSQAVVNIVKLYKDPLEACRAVVEEAYNRWLQFEVRTDDITCICIFLDEAMNDVSKAAVPTREGSGTSGKHHRNSIIAGREVLLAMQDSIRPVRGIGGGSKSWRSRQTIIGADAIHISMLNDSTSPNIDNEPTFDVNRHTVLKSEEDKSALRKMVENNFLFSHLDDDKLDDVIAVMEKETVISGQVLIRQNDEGDKFYLAEAGKFDVRVLPQDTKPLTTSSASMEEQYGPVVHSYAANSTTHPTFGELALLYSKPRAATVVATSDGTVWSISRNAFRAILARRPLRNIVHRLRNCALFKSLTVAQLSLLAEEMKSVIFEKDAIVCREGSASDKFYLVVNGAIANSKTDQVYHTHDTFNDFVLESKSSICPATMIAQEATECLYITRNSFEATIGNLSSVISKHQDRINRKHAIAAAKQTTPMHGFVTLGTPLPELSKLTSVDQLTIGPTVFHDEFCAFRLVTTEDDQTLTLRSIPKQVAGQLKYQLTSEQDMLLALDSESLPTAIMPIYAVAHTETDLHALFAAPFVCMLEDFNIFPLAESSIRYYGAQLILALQAFHAEGILCRSLDPTNIMIDAKGQFSIVGLRQSKYIGAGRTYTICGNPEYLAPEQINGYGQCLVSDYWSLGVLLYEMASGETPFQGKEELDMFHSIANFTSETLKFPEHVSASLRSLIEDLLKTKPTERLGWVDAVETDESPIMDEGFFESVNWDQLRANELQAPLEEAAAVKYRDIINTAPGSKRTLGLDVPYTGNVDWMTDF
ncbi:cGMP-dependent protein kinase [Thraustotheca clavata]|uniref:protein-serine/threonine phosphatase n=1 Tax=Thraustotheca clavata TaxID=74557 RepID=A0A1V9ZBF7_9STRA|nr:cGMP-dependent protein kinase [Thraustotheca clavata]